MERFLTLVPHAAKTPASLLRKIRASAASRFLCVVQEPTLPVWLRQKMSCLRVLCQNCKENAFCQNFVFSCFHSIEAVHDCMCEFLCPFRNTGRAVAEKVAQVLPPCVATPAGLFYAGVQCLLPAPRLPRTSVCKTSLGFSSMRGDPGWPFCMPGSRARSLSSDS